MRIPYHGNGILGIRHIPERPPHGRKENYDNQGMDRAEECQGRTELLGVRELLPTIYQGLQQNHQSFDTPDQEGTAVGVGRQTTESLRHSQRG